MGTLDPGRSRCSIPRARHDGVKPTPEASDTQSIPRRATRGGHPLLPVASITAVVLGALVQEPLRVHPQTPALTLEHGRAVLVQNGSRGETVLPGEPRRIVGPAHLRVVADAHATLSWPGIGTLKLAGPVELEWSGPTLRAGEPLVEPSTLELSVHTLGEIWRQGRLSCPSPMVGRRPSAAVPTG